MGDSKDDFNDKALLKVLANKANGCLAIFGRGDYYAVYDKDALLVATHIFKSDVCLKRLTLQADNDYTMDYVTMNEGQFEKVVREAITLLRYRVVLYKYQDGEWTIEAKGTVGNAGDFEDIVGDADKASNFAVFLHSKLDDNRITVCSWDITQLRIVVTEFNDTTAFSNFEQCVIGLNPTNCLILRDQLDTEKDKKLSNVLSNLNVAESEHRSMANWEQVCSVFKSDHLEKVNEFSRETRECMMNLCSFLLADDIEQYEGKFSLTNYGTTGFMHLDAAAVNALELFRLNYNYSGENGGAGSATLYSVLNKCKTLPGQKLLRDWLARPLTDVRQLEERQDAIAALISADEIRRLLGDVLTVLPDCSALSKRLIRETSTLLDLYRTFHVLTQLNRVCNLLMKLSETEDGVYKNAVKELLVEPIRFCEIYFENFTSLVENTIDLDYYKKKNELRVLPSLSSELQQSATDMDAIEADCEKIRKKLAAKTEVDGIKLERNSKFGFYFRMTSKDEKSIRNNGEIIILDSKKGSGISFTVKGLEPLNARYQEIHGDFKKDQEKLTKSVLKTSRELIEYLPFLSSSLSTMDVLISLAEVSATASRSYVRPKLLPLGSGVLNLKQCRHAVIEQKSEEQFIPNDVVFGS
ncbi:unnamed protein product [Caenorhabditis auriculariae]|uniref:DNA mismatch repair protein MutS core domain-containing protein n=1 Tax=Caenorhabditis auriculariae TaxID=2777116 RepID=A0A8S1GPQ6_9PELO|nr:unnamed protein product [Caenorhabditis auriculariae]